MQIVAIIPAIINVSRLLSLSLSFLSGYIYYIRLRSISFAIKR